jgi:glycosyltransferase involved in cell wall biosynthesis
MFDLCVIIATAGRPELLKRTLQSLGQCRLPAGYQRTIVVENGSQAGAEEVVRSAPAVLNAQYLHCPRSNKSEALNAALGTAGDGLIFFTDDDVRLDPAVLTAYLKAAEASGPGHFFGGPAGADFADPPPSWLTQYLPKSARGWEWPGPDNQVRSPEFLGFNWAAFAGDLLAAGGFNPDRGPGSPSGSTGQESDMQRRLLRRSLLGLYVPGARVWHYVPRDRCSTRWAIARNFRHGVEEGARRADELGSLGLPPRWFVRRYLKGIARIMLWSYSPDPERRFKAKFHHQYNRGLLHGMRWQRKADRTKSANSPAPIA